MRDIELVERFLGAINAHDIECIAVLMSADHEFIDGLGGLVRGRESVCAAWQSYLALCPDYWVKADEIIAGGNRYALFGAAGGTIVEAESLHAANEWRIPAAWRAVIEGGLIERWQVFSDNKPVYDILARQRRDQSE